MLLFHVSWFWNIKIKQTVKKSKRKLRSLQGSLFRLRYSATRNSFINLKEYNTVTLYIVVGVCNAKAKLWLNVMYPLYCTFIYSSSEVGANNSSPGSLRGFWLSCLTDLLEENSYSIVSKVGRFGVTFLKLDHTFGRPEKNDTAIIQLYV